MRNFRHRVALIATIVLVATNGLARAAPPSTAPPAGLRETAPAVHAIVGARIVVSPQRTIDAGTLVVRDGVIEAVGEDVANQFTAGLPTWENAPGYMNLPIML